MTKITHLGIIGGMGPLASAEFVRTLYHISPYKKEQDKLKVSLISDPSIPDRTTYLLKGDDGLLIEHLQGQISTLTNMGASHIIICCVTIHHLLPKLTSDYTRNIISLLDLLIDKIKKTEEKTLILCTNGSRQLQVLERHPHFSEIKHLVQFLDPNDQQKLHEMIYFFKENNHLPGFNMQLLKWCWSYQCSAIAGACTEMHPLLNNYRQENFAKSTKIIDPLYDFASSLDLQN